MMVVFVVEIRGMMIMVLMEEDDKEISTVFGIRLVIVLSFMNNFTLRYWAKIYYTSNHIICLDFVWIATWVMGYGLWVRLRPMPLRVL